MFSLRELLQTLWPWKSKPPCNVCLDLDIRRPDEFDPEGALQERAQKLIGRRPFDESGQLFIQAGALLASAEAGCLSCLLLNQAWLQIASHENAIREGDGFHVNAWEGMSWGGGKFRSPGKFLLNPPWIHPLSFTSYTIHTEPGRACPWSSAIMSHPWQVFLPTVDQVRRFVEPQIQKCLNSHTKCASLTNSGTRRLPTRLVMVEDTFRFTSSYPPISLRLVETSSTAMDSSHETRYIALSHCWGTALPSSPEMIKTETENLRDFKQAIPWAELSSTFRDTALVARGMGIRFLWIDSLCIIQDDKEDWKREAKKMASVYQNAWLTIAASGAAHGGQGLFLANKDQSSLRPGVHEIQPPGLKYPVYMRETFLAPFTEAHWSQLGSSQPLGVLPLMSRGWTLQEQVCSPRLLHFTEKELIFECCSGMSCECTASFEGSPGSVKQYLGNSFCGTHYSWYSLMKEFTSRSLTYENDRLPALWGVADLYSQLQGPVIGAYLAGLWESDMEYGLEWMVEKSTTTRPQRITPELPSWSFASIGTASIQWPRWEFQEHLVEFLKPLNSQVTLAEVPDGGRITLRGRLCPVSLDLRTEPRSEMTPTGNCNRHQLSFSEGTAPEHLVTTFMPDGELDSSRSALKAHFLPMSLNLASSLGSTDDNYRTKNQYVLRGLVLHQHTGENSLTDRVEPTHAESASGALFSRLGCAHAFIAPEDEHRDSGYEIAKPMFAKWRNEEFIKFGEEQDITIA